MTLTRRILGRISALALVAGMTVAVATAPPASAKDDPVAGAMTAGDSLFPNQGNGGYDVSHYDINLSVDVTPSATPNAVGTSSFSSAQTTITASTTGGPLSSYSFDLQGLTVSSVIVNGTPAAFSRIDTTTTSNATTDVHKLIVTPATPVSGTFTTVVNYSGTPTNHTDTDGSSEGWNNTTDGATFVNQPVGAMTAFPNNNTPSDKATYTISVDVPTKLKTSNYASMGGKAYPSAVASNGELVSKTPNGDGSRTTWVWNETKPMATELSLISIGRYDVYESDVTLNSGRTLHEWTFIDPAISAANQASTQVSRAQWKSLLDFYESKYGPYPGNSIGIVTDVVPSAINYALETQDRSFFPNSASNGTFYHEVMHQWFGDSVSPFDWNDIWLNEGTATYSETQVPYEALGTSTSSTETSLYNSWNSTAASSSLWSPVTVASMTQASQLFGNPTYTRGSMAEAALKTVIGDANFETLMRQDQSANKGTSRRTSDFIARAQAISGKDLTAFFNSWIYTTGKPAWPAKFNLSMTGPDTANPGDTVNYVLTVKNTGKVTLPTGSVATASISNLIDDATLGTLPNGVTVSGNTLSWAIPSTAVGATSTVTIPATVNPATDGNTLAIAVAPSTATLGGTCGVCSAATIISAPPVIPAGTPAITGTPTVGTATTFSTGTWAPNTVFSYQWYVDGLAVPGATASTYTPTVYDSGLGLKVAVTGKVAGATRTTVTSAAVTVAKGTPAAPVPTITGTPKIGSPLTAVTTGWEPGSRLTFQWRANGTNISGATAPSYTPAVASQVGQTIDVVVSATKAGFNNGSNTSAATAAVAAGDPLTMTPTPTLNGTPTVGVPYIPTYGDWDDGVTLTFTWQANGTTISGATAASFTPTATQLGLPLTVTVTGTKGGVAAVTKVSAPSAVVAGGTQTLQPTPTITGTGRALSTFTGNKGTWDSSTAQTFKWYADGNVIGGATAATYTPTIDQVGAAITFEVTSTRAGYTTVVKTSLPTTVLPAAQVLTPTPTINGTPKVGVELTGVPGTWDAGTSLAYQWTADGDPIASATGLTFTPDASYAGKVIKFVVTSTKTGYSDATKSSAGTDPVAAGDQVLTPTPTINGTPKVGIQLTGVPGTWDVGTSLAYQWLSDGDPIDGATGLTYTPAADDAGTAITFAVTATKGGYSSVTKTSDPTDDVAKGDLSLTPTPTFVGSPKAGTSFASLPGFWDDGVTLSYQWSADGTPIDGATDASYTPTVGQIGSVLTVAVTGTKAGYTSVTKTSAGSDKVVGDLTSTPTPTLVGTPKALASFASTPGTWDDGTTLSYQWYANGTAIDGATSASYTPTIGQIGAVLKVAVTGTKTNYVTVTKTSADSAPVAAASQVLTPTPTITGTPKVAVQLTGVPGTWDAGTTLTYQWFAGGTAVSGETGLTYTPAASAQGKTITFAVTSTRTGYATVTKTSTATAAVANGTLVSTPTPTFIGDPRALTSYAALPGTWDDGVTLSYQWSADGTAIPGATSANYTPTIAQIGSVLRVAVTGTKTGYTTVTKTSDPSAPVAAVNQALTPTPTISGTAKVDSTLTGVPGTWDDGTTLTYQWLAGGVAIAGKTGLTYTPDSSVVGKTITFAVTSTKANFVTVTKTSAPTAAVTVSTLASTPTPTITGTPKVDSKLTGVPGTWDAGTTLSYKWLANGVLVAGQTGLTFTPGAAYAGKTIAFSVTGTKAGYTTVTKTSAATAKVALGSQVLNPTPKITGTAKVGKTLTVTPGKHDAGTTLHIQWFANGVAIDGANATTLKLTSKYVGKKIKVKVVSTKPGYGYVSATCAPTAAVAKA